jgi:hypothetical protein
MNRTGYAIGRLNPIIYFEDAQGNIAMPPSTADARWIYNEARDAQGLTYKDRKYEWREAGTLNEVDKLQARLTELKMRELRDASERDERIQDALWKEIGGRLRARMVNRDCTPYERDFIDGYLQLKPAKRAKHRQRFLETTMYLEAREMDSSSHATDRIKG